MADKKPRGDAPRSDIASQDAGGADVPSGYQAEVSRDEVQSRDAGRADGRPEPKEEDQRIVATVHADSTPSAEDPDVRPIGNTDVPVNARDPGAP